MEEVRETLGAAWVDKEEELFGPAEALHSTYRLLRDELLEGTARIVSVQKQIARDIVLRIGLALGIGYVRASPRARARGDAQHESACHGPTWQHPQERGAGFSHPSYFGPFPSASNGG